MTLSTPEPCHALEIDEVWDRHGAALYAMARVLVGEETVAARLVTESVLDLPLTASPGMSPDMALRTAARQICRRSHQAFPGVQRRKLRAASPIMVGLGDLAHLQRQALALCLFGGHTYGQAAEVIGVSADLAALLLLSGLRELSASHVRRSVSPATHHTES